MSEKLSELERWPGKTVGEIRDAYDEEEARGFTRFGWLLHLVTGRWRRPQFSGADGRVLDVACGTGVNFRYVPETADIVGIDVSPDMLEFARQEAADLGRELDLERMDAQHLSFEDDSFDTVISSFSTCTFPDPIEALNEMARVCRPDGDVRLLEHGKSHFGPYARFQEWRSESEYRDVGCRLFDDPTEVVKRSELAVEVERKWHLGAITGIVARPPKD
ncbi:class I SAM-dependent methyltransferase [Halorarum halophilum]|uniref:Class I SAM-dependent methyltransferase n=1 Tax=Halorarum halophilum TaxID=2743090 RepID=A0A7D5GGW3_9EURY|nr:class I SAM-dependent methyltransferase [Halobaculum halophilum]QLG27111.1 class I SAM-dependent methyltransferase [Halobaculum halophilum]